MPLPHYHGGYHHSVDTSIIFPDGLVLLENNTADVSSLHEFLIKGDVSIKLPYNDISKVRSVKLDELLDGKSPIVRVVTTIHNLKGEIVRKYDSQYRIESFTTNKYKEVDVQFKNLSTQFEYM